MVLGLLVESGELWRGVREDGAYKGLPDSGEEVCSPPGHLGHPLLLTLPQPQPLSHLVQVFSCESRPYHWFAKRMNVKGSVVDPHALKLDPDQGFWPNLEPGSDPWLCNQF